MILYLHGFISGPASTKARQLGTRMDALGLAERFVCPQLPPSPQAAIGLATALIESAKSPVTLVGSSLGGYYATWLAEAYACQAVLINPASVAHRSLAGFVGRQTNLYSGESFDFLPEYVDQLAAIEVASITRPERLWLMVETGDELLDYRVAVRRYAGARQTVIAGGDHNFRHWPQMIDEVIRFAGLA